METELAGKQHQLTSGKTGMVGNISRSTVTMRTDSIFFVKTNIPSIPATAHLKPADVKCGTTKRLNRPLQA